MSMLFALQHVPLMNCKQVVTSHALYILHKKFKHITHAARSGDRKEDVCRKTHSGKFTHSLNMLNLHDRRDVLTVTALTFVMTPVGDQWSCRADNVSGWNTNWRPSITAIKPFNSQTHCSINSAQLKFFLPPPPNLIHKICCLMASHIYTYTCIYYVYCIYVYSVKEYKILGDSDWLKAKRLSLDIVKVSRTT